MNTSARNLRERFSSEQGGTLLITLLVTSIIGLALASSLGLIMSGHKSNARSASWNLTIPVLEGGIEEALAHLNRSGGAPLASDGWSFQSPSSYVKQLQLGNDETYSITTISAATPPVIESQGFVRVPLSATSYLSRKVRVTTRQNSLFAKGLVAKGQIDMHGNNIRIDSFDSTDPTYSTGGLYDPAKTKENGDVATNAELINSLNIGNADIYGDVSTGPGGTIALGPGGLVTGHISDDMNEEFPDVAVPYTNQSGPSSGTVGGVSYTYVLGTGSWQINGNLSLSGNSGKILVTGDAVLYVTGNVSLSGNSFIQIAPTGSLKLYVGGSSTSIGGNGVMNSTGIASKFSYYGLPTNTSVSFSGNAAFVGVIYAPSAALSLGGGGNNTYDFVGASISNTASLNGHFNFHYDEYLGRIGPFRGYVVTSWNEI